MSIPARSFSAAQPRRIVCCVPALKPPDTDSSSFLQQMLIRNGLRARGHAVSFAAPSDMSEVMCFGDSETPQTMDRTWTRKWWFKFLSKVCWRMQQIVGLPYLNVFSNLRWMDAYMQCLPGYDIVQERNGIYRMGVAMACRRLCMPFVYFLDSDDILEHDLFGNPLKGLLRWRAKKALLYNLHTADRIVCVSELAKAHLVSSWDIPAEKVVVVPNGVDVNAFRPYPESRAEVRKEYGFDDGPLIVFIGTFFPYQDVPGLLKAFAEVLRQYPAARLLLIGRGEHQQTMVQMASDLALSDSVKFAGFRQHSLIPRLLGAADIAVAPYRKIENRRFLISSMKVFEYMAAGVAVVTSDLGQLSEVIKNGINGLLVPAEDTQSLAGALLRLIADPQLRSRLGQQARKDCIDLYSWDKHVLQLEKLYESVLESHKMRMPGKTR